LDKTDINGLGMKIERDGQRLGKQPGRGCGDNGQVSFQTQG
jgi:hypothetical protein